MLIIFRWFELRGNNGVQALFKRSRHNNVSIFMISQDYYELRKRTIRANGSISYLQTIQFQRCAKSLSRQSKYGYDT